MIVSVSPTDPLMATFNEKTRAPTSRKYVAEQGIVMPNWSKTFQTFQSHFSVFALEKQPKNLKETSRLHEVEQVVLMPNLSETVQVFGSHSSFFP